MEIEVKICPKCGQKNIRRANYCTNPNCDYRFSKDEPDQGNTPSPVPPVQGASTNMGSEDGDAPIIQFEMSSDEILEKIKDEAASCNQSLKTFGALKNYTDEELKHIYGKYVANFQQMDDSMGKIEALSKDLDIKYRTAALKLERDLPARKRSLQRAYQEKKDAILSLVTRMVDEFKKQKPFSQCKGFQLSSISDWKDIPASVQLPRRFSYIGRIHRKYHVLGNDLAISRREYLELLNCKNLVLHYDSNTKAKCLHLVSTLLGRMLKATEGQLLHICVFDPQIGLGLNPDFKEGLPPELYSVEKRIDTSRLLEQERRILQMTGGRSVEDYNQSRQAGDNLLGYQILVFQDWYVSLRDRVGTDEVQNLASNNIKAGYCLIFMVNDDNKPDKDPYHGQDEGDVLSDLPNCAVIDLKKQWADETQQLELMSDEQIFEVVKEIHNIEVPQSKDIDVGALLEEKKRWGLSKCQNGFSLYIGKNGSLQDVNLHLTDNIIQQSLLVNYRGATSNVFPWINAMIAQAFTLYNPEELNVMVADFTGNDELAALSGRMNIVEAPFYYLGLNTDNQTSVSKEKIGNMFPRLFPPFYNDGKGKRLLAFIIGKNDDIRKYVIDKFYLEKPRLHFVLVTTDVAMDDSRRRRAFEGYQISFGPMRHDRSSRLREEDTSLSLSGDEFLFEGAPCQAYSFSVEKTRQIIQRYLKEPTASSPSSSTSKPLPERAVEEKAEANPQKPFAEEVTGTSDRNTEVSSALVQKDLIEEFAEEEKYDYQRVFRFQEYMLPEDEWWKQSCADVFDVPFGIHIDRENDMDRVVSFWFENEEAMSNAALVLGGTGSGKTTFLQALIISATQRYSPKELELYLIDFKNAGFLPFERYNLPHARVVAGGADREFGLSILNQLELELNLRINNPEKVYPRTVLIIDECQDFFLDDNIANEATRILERIIKKGRQFGINIIIATQELSSNTTRIPSSLYENIAIRVVAKPKARDYDALFSRRNSNEEMEALKTSFKKGELLYVKDTLMNSSSPIEEYHAKSFYIQYDRKDIDNSELKKMVERLAMFAQTHKEACREGEKAFFFHHDDPLMLFSKKLMKEGHRKTAGGLPKEIPVYLGQPIAMSDHIYIPLTNERNQAILIMGASDAPVGQGIAYNGLVSSLVPYPAGKRVDYVFDFTKNNDPLYGKLQDVVNGRPFDPRSEVIPNDEGKVVEKLREIKAMLEERMTQSPDKVDHHVYVSIFGLDRGNMFGVDVSNSGGYLDNYLEATELLNYILINGSFYGIFTMIQFTGRLDLLSKMLNIGSNYALFTHVVVLQLEIMESVNLINDHRFLYDQASAQMNPGLYRALYLNRTNPYIIQKFKPYKF